MAALTLSSLSSEVTNRWTMMKLQRNSICGAGIGSQIIAA
jgi:hypothetical protein